MQIDTLIAQVKPYIERGRKAYDNFSGREQMLLVGGLGIFLLLATMAIVQPIQNLFSEQSLQLVEAENNVREMASAINRYQRLVQRRTEIERDFQSVEIKESALSLLEGLIKGKAGISQGAFTIKEQAPKPFGNNYLQTFFAVKFSTTDYPRLIDFLQEMVDGPKPLVLKRLDVKRNRGGDKLDVDLEVSSITKEK